MASPWAKAKEFCDSTVFNMILATSKNNQWLSHAVIYKSV
jgi:hypothetical protein